MVHELTPDPQEITRAGRVGLGTFLFDHDIADDAGVGPIGDHCADVVGEMCFRQAQQRRTGRTKFWVIGIGPDPIGGADVSDHDRRARTIIIVVTITIVIVALPETSVANHWHFVPPSLVLDQVGVSLSLPAKQCIG
jgi:hypothetical protein